MATPCTPASCLLPAASWCTSARSCDTVTGSCLLVPRCQSTPFLGCLEQAQKCVDITGLAAPMPTADWQHASVTTIVVFFGFLACLTVLLLGLVVQRKRQATL
jgi:hypothetical protein